MKTKEQIKSEVVNYLTKASKHIYIKPKISMRYNPLTKACEIGEIDYENFTYFKVIKNESGFQYLEKVGDTYRLKNIDIDYYIKYWYDAKCVISHMLFLEKKMKSVKNNKQFKEILNDIKNDL